MSKRLETLKVILPDSELEQYLLKVPESGTPLWYYWETFVQHRFDKGRSSVTTSSVRDALKVVMRKLEIYSIETCNDTNHLDKKLMLLKEERGFSKSTFNSYLKNINCYFIWLEKRGHIEVNKVRKIDRCQEPQKEQLVLSEENVKQIKARLHMRRQTRLERLRNILFVDLLVLTGARPSEIIGIQTKDIRVYKGTYKLVIKGKKQKGRLRYYRMPSWARDSYENYITYKNKLRPEEKTLLMSVSKRTGWTHQGVRGLLNQLSKELGFPITAMAFRRFVATKLNKGGVDMKDIQSHLGHTRASTTLRYIERSCFLTNKGVDVMDKFLGE